MTNQEIQTLKRLDTVFFSKQIRKQGLVPPSQEVVLVSLHKVRYMTTEGIPREMRRESKEWLRENGFKGINGYPLLEEGVLPGDKHEE